MSTTPAITTTFTPKQRKLLQALTNKRAKLTHRISTLKAELHLLTVQLAAAEADVQALGTQITLLQDAQAQAEKYAHWRARAEAEFKALRGGPDDAHEGD